MRFMERDDRNAIRYERELRKKYLKSLGKNKDGHTQSNSPGFEKFKRKTMAYSE